MHVCSSHVVWSGHDKYVGSFLMHFVAFIGKMEKFCSFHLHRFADVYKCMLSLSGWLDHSSTYCTSEKGVG